MKKTYFSPSVKVYKVTVNKLLAGSFTDGTNRGTTTSDTEGMTGTYGGNAETGAGGAAKETGWDDDF